MADPNKETNLPMVAGQSQRTQGESFIPNVTGPNAQGSIPTRGSTTALPAGTTPQPSFVHDVGDAPRTSADTQQDVVRQGLGVSAPDSPVGPGNVWPAGPPSGVPGVGDGAAPTNKVAAPLQQGTQQVSPNLDNSTGEFGTNKQDGELPVKESGVLAPHDNVAASYNPFAAEQSGAAYERQFGTPVKFSTQNMAPLLKGGVLEGHEQDIINSARKAGIPPDMFAAVITQETGHGTSNALVQHNNPAGVMDWNNQWKTIKHFNSLQEGMDFAAHNMRKNFFDKGLNTVDDIGTKYAPIGAANDPRGLNKSWAPNVKRFLQQMRGEQAPATTGA